MLSKEARAITNDYLSMITQDTYNSENLLAAYEEQKAFKLDELFGGNLIIEKNVTFEESTKVLAEKIAREDLFSLIVDALDEEVKAEVFLENYENKISYCIRNMFCIRSLAGQVLLEDYEMIIPSTEKTLKFSKGTKITKVLRKLISNPEKLEEIQIKYSRVFNNRFIQGVLCLSIHPLDYLTASVNKADWTSCYDTLRRGEYCASTLSLITSPNTMIAYLKSSKDVDYNGIEWNSKKWRTLVSLSDDNELIHVGRNYPYDNVSLMKEVSAMVGELTGKQYGNMESETNRVTIETPQNMYNDASGEDRTTFVTDEFESLKDIIARKTIHISDIGAICVACGSAYDYCEEDIRCSSCTEGCVCDNCGDRCSEDEGYYVPSSGENICYDCHNRYYADCERCGEVVNSTRMVTRKYLSGNCSEPWCEDCISAKILSGELDVCESCGEAMTASLLNEDNLCHDCV